MRTQPPPQVKQVRRIPVHFDGDSGIMYPYRSSRPWIGLTDGEMPLRILPCSWAPDGTIAQLEQDIAQWEMLMGSPEWHLVGTESELDSASKEGMSSDGELLPLAEAHGQSVGYCYNHFAVFHKY